MEFNADNFKFSPDLLKLSGGKFKAFLKDRYGKLTAKQRKEIFDKFYGKPSDIPKETIKDSE